MRKENDIDYADYSSLIGLVYDAAQNPALWPELLEELGEFFSFNPSSDGLTASEDILQPHFSRAITINRHISKLETKNSTSNQILNRLPIGVIITDKNAENVAMNERASIVLDHRSALMSNKGVIRTNNLQQTNELHQLIHSYASGQHPEKGASLHIRGNNRSDTSIWITASDNQTANIAGHANIAIIYIASSLIQPEYDVQFIQDNFGLTTAEARLVKTLVSGCHNLNDAAKDLGLSIHTVRTQIKRIFDKTGTSNQMELVKKILTSPSAIFGESQPPRQISTNQKRETGLSADCCPFITLHDGRRLSYEEYGDPEGHPVFMFHAFLGSRLLYPANETTALKLGLRFIVPDRPGHGYSDLKKDRTLLDWPGDVIQLADSLKLKRFSVLGYSGGGGYALACAYKIPERIETMVLVSARTPCIAPPYEGLSLDRFFSRYGEKCTGTVWSIYESCNCRFTQRPGQSTGTTLQETVRERSSAYCKRSGK